MPPGPLRVQERFPERALMRGRNGGHSSPGLAETQQYKKAGWSATSRGSAGHGPFGPASHQGTDRVDQRQVRERSLELSNSQGGKPCLA